ncbi:hypothetical protein ACHQM5_014586 [Ranunculus cassubicifolius]
MELTSLTPTPTFLPTNPQNPNNLLTNPKSLSISFTKTLIPSILTTNHYPKITSINAYYNTNNLSFNGDDQGQEQEPLEYPRPSEIPWNKEICNSVHLIGIIGTPVQLKNLSSGKVLAWTRLGVRKSATDTTWINLTFWNELAHVASQHVEKGQQVYVSGRLVADTVEGDDEKTQTYYKVVVQQLNFVEKSPVPVYDQGRTSSTAVGQGGNYATKTTSSTQELWQAFFANPVDWWDNRKNKRNLKYPDFKHKDTGEALWVDGKANPPWVKSQLAILDSKMPSFDANGTSAPVSYMSSDDLTF